jgi:hypothetical protein
VKSAGDSQEQISGDINPPHWQRSDDYSLPVKEFSEDELAQVLQIIDRALQTSLRPEDREDVRQDILAELCAREFGPEEIPRVAPRFIASQRRLFPIHQYGPVSLDQLDEYGRPIVETTVFHQPSLSRVVVYKRHRNPWSESEMLRRAADRREAREKHAAAGPHERCFARLQPCGCRCDWCISRWDRLRLGGSRSAGYRSRLNWSRWQRIGEAEPGRFAAHIGRLVSAHSRRTDHQVGLT